MVDKRTYIKVHDGMDEHPKVEPLSDKAFRLLMSTWFWCSRNKTDGRVGAASWAKRGTKKARDELAAAGLVEVRDGYVQVHDYLEHQRSAEQIAEAVEKKKDGARLGNHRRWHVDGTTDPECEWCPPLEPSDPDPPPDDPPSHDRSDMRSDNRSDEVSVTDRFGSPEDRGQITDKRTTPVGMAAPDSNVSAKRPPRGSSGPTAADAHRLVRRILGLGFPAVTLTDLAIRAAELLQQFDEPTVAEAIAEWGTRTGIGPGVLPSLVADIVKRRNGHTRRDHRPNADDTIADLLNPTGTDGAVILQLSRGDT